MYIYPTKKRSIEPAKGPCFCLKKNLQRDDGVSLPFH